MVQLQIISGPKAGVCFSNSRLPLQVGRAADSDILCEEPGVWPRHFQIFRHDLDLVCRAEPNALLAINDVQKEEAILRNGDIISIGALKIRFALSPVHQSSLRLRELLLWTSLAILCLGQVILAYNLIR